MRFGKLRLLTGRATSSHQTKSLVGDGRRNSPREDQHRLLTIPRETSNACPDVLDERGRLAALEICDEPFCVGGPVRWTAEVDAVAADDDEVRGHSACVDGDVVRASRWMEMAVEEERG